MEWNRKGNFSLLKILLKKFSLRQSKKFRFIYYTFALFLLETFQFQLNLSGPFINLYVFSADKSFAELSLSFSVEELQIDVDGNKSSATFTATKTIQNSIFQKLSWWCITKDHVDFFVVVDDVLARRFFPVWTVDWCFLVFFAAASMLLELNELEFKLWVASVWFPNSRSSWKARKPSCGWDASLSALERMQARYWSAESFWPFWEPEQTCTNKTFIKTFRKNKNSKKQRTCLTFGCQIWKIPGSVVRMTFIFDLTYLR